MLKTLTPLSLTSLLGAFLLVGATSLYAQTSTSPSPAPGGDMTKKEKMKAAHQQASQACQGKTGDEHRDCMRTQMCAQAKDPAKCEARWKEHAEAFNKAYDVCKGKATADEFRACMRKQHVDARK